jgi:uncharacterized protein (UPF0303 family)
MTADSLPTVDSLDREERALRFERFDHQTAWELGLALVAKARAADAPVTVDIRRGGQQLFHAALPGTAPDNDAWILRKQRVVERFGRSSLNVGERARQAGTTFEEQMRLDPDLYAAHGGAFPVTVRGVGVVGAVAVSGLPQVEDHRLVVEVLSEFLGVDVLTFAD